MKKGLLLFTLISTLFLLHGNQLHAQNKNVGIGISTPHPSAILHVEDNDPTNPAKHRGVRIPYTDTNAVNAYANSYTPAIPIANGLVIFQKGAETFYYYDAKKSKWIPLSGITGPTGVKGPTGPPGDTGRTGFSGKIRSGNGAPTLLASDTCGYYYIDMVNALMYKLNCPGGWAALSGPYKNNIFGGETVHLSTTSQLIVNPGPANSAPPNPLPGLSYQVSAPPGFSAYAYIKAYGAVRKVQVNNEYNYAKFDIHYPIAGGKRDKWQVVTMGPTGPAPHFHQELVKWSVAFADDLGSGKLIEINGANMVKGVTNLGAVELCGGPGSETQAHMEIIVVYVRN